MVENPNNPLLQRNAKWIRHFEPNIEEAIGLLFFLLTGIGLIAALGFGMLKNAKISLNNR